MALIALWTGHAARRRRALALCVPLAAAAAISGQQWSRTQQAQSRYSIELQVAEDSSNRAQKMSGADIVRSTERWDNGLK